jgi:hypothetical protein
MSARGGLPARARVGQLTQRVAAKLVAATAVCRAGGHHSVGGGGHWLKGRVARSNKTIHTPKRVHCQQQVSCFS